MIRSAAFFILSLALHATALVYPVSFRGTGQFETIQIEILPMDQEAGGAGAQGGSGDPASRSDSRSNRTTPPPIESRAGSKSSDRSDSQALPAEALPQFSDRSPTSVSAIENSPEANGIIMAESASNHLQSYSAGGVETVNGGSASASSGTGPGSGNGSGSGSSGSVITVSQARYLDTPKPSYPEIARREGLEGRVLLRVLVDEQGRTKTVEINSSSGNEALDRAAAEAVKRWHFQPARYDDRAVESWLRIPIEFRLADAKSW